MKPAVKALAMTMREIERERHGKEMQNNGNGNYTGEYRDRSYATENRRGGGMRNEHDYGMTYERNNYTNNGEARFRDNRGRKRYNDGRYAPENTMEDDDEDARMEIGFSVPDPIKDNISYMGYPRMGGGQKSHAPMGMTHGGREKMDRALAEEWVSSMENEDGTSGAHWSFDQAKQVMAQKGVPGNPVEFFAALNMLYSDYCKVFKKYGLADKLDFYVDLTKAFLDDKDAGPDKLARYYECVVSK